VPTCWQKAFKGDELAAFNARTKKRLNKKPMFRDGRGNAEDSTLINEGADRTSRFRPDTIFQPRLYPTRRTGVRV
jgi:hypothetical protein